MYIRRLSGYLKLMEKKTETPLDREIRADLEKEKHRKTKAVQIWNILGLIVALGLLFIDYKIWDLGSFRDARFGIIILVLLIVSSIGKRSWWK
jgi:hypothetical protein